MYGCLMGIGEPRATSTPKKKKALKRGSNVLLSNAAEPCYKQLDVQQMGMYELRGKYKSKPTW